MSAMTTSILEIYPRAAESECERFGDILIERDLNKSLKKIETNAGIREKVAYKRIV